MPVAARHHPRGVCCFLALWRHAFNHGTPASGNRTLGQPRLCSSIAFSTALPAPDCEIQYCASEQATPISRQPCAERRSTFYTARQPRGRKLCPRRMAARLPDDEHHRNKHAHAHQPIQCRYRARQRFLLGNARTCDPVGDIHRPLGCHQRQLTTQR